jgi:L-alanine-DL-glutamate epimerase-like enolase superfamily enzyme
MKISNLRIRELEGIMEYPGTFWEERLRMPTDIYPEYREMGPELMAKHPIPLGDGTYKVVLQFLQIETDEGLTGLSGPMFYPSSAFLIDTTIKRHLIGKDPLRTELHWDVMYRSNMNARAGDATAAMSMVDIALWDLKGKFLGQPVCNLLGGPVQDKIPCYASALCCSIEPAKVTARVREFLSAGYPGAKFFVRDGPKDGQPGIERNLELIKAIRNAGGPDFKVMLDAWNSWDVPYTMKMALLSEGYGIEWFEEPVMPDYRKSLARLRDRCPIQIAGGEHDFTRWGAKTLMDMDALDIYQFDAVWVGGISELLKIATLCSLYDVPLIPHGVSMQATAHLAFAQNAAVVPMLEYLLVEQERFQFFFKEKLKPVDGYFYPPASPGLGMDLDEATILSEREIRFS